MYRHAHGSRQPTVEANVLMTIVDGEIFSRLQVLSGVVVMIMLSCMQGAAPPAVRDRPLHYTAMQRAGWEKRSSTRKVRHRPAERFANRLGNVPIRTDHQVKPDHVESADKSVQILRHIHRMLVTIK